MENQAHALVTKRIKAEGGENREFAESCQPEGKWADSLATISPEGKSSHVKKGNKATNKTATQPFPGHSENRIPG